MTMYDTKANILHAFSLINISVAKSYTKDTLTDIWEHLFKTDLFLIVNQLPKEEQKMFSKLLLLKQNEYITYPRNDERFLLMQKLYLTVTYEGKDYWHIYMPDSIRKHVLKSLEADMNYHPEMRPFHQTMEKLNSCNDRLFDLVQNKKKRKPDQLATEAKAIKADMQKYFRELKAQEQQVKKFGVDVDMLYSQITEQIKLCDMVISTAPMSILDGQLSKKEKAAKDYMTMLAAKKEQELEDAKKNDGKPVNFLPAITCQFPYAHKDLTDIHQKLIRPRVLEVVVRLTEATYMTCYIIQQPTYVFVSCCWGDVLDFVWNGTESPTPWDPYTTIKKPFHKKYPQISSLFGQKEDRNSQPLPEPYLTTIGMNNQPKVWWLSTKITDATD